MKQDSEASHMLGRCLGPRFNTIMKVQASIEYLKVQFNIQYSSHIKRFFSLFFLSNAWLHEAQHVIFKTFES